MHHHPMHHTLQLANHTQSTTAQTHQVTGPVSISQSSLKLPQGVNGWRAASAPAVAALPAAGLWEQREHILAGRSAPPARHT